MSVVHGKQDTQVNQQWITYLGSTARDSAFWYRLSGHAGCPVLSGRVALLECYPHYEIHLACDDILSDEWDNSNFKPSSEVQLVPEERQLHAVVDIVTV